MDRYDGQIMICNPCKLLVKFLEVIVDFLSWQNVFFPLTYLNIRITFQTPFNCLVNHSKVFILGNNLIFNTAISYDIVHYECQFATCAKLHITFGNIYDGFNSNVTFL